MSLLHLKIKLLRNLGANAYGQLITVIIQLASVPFFLNYWGVELYGEWLILSAIPSYLSLSDIGFATVAANDMAMRVAKGDQRGALESYQSIWIFICCTSILVGSVLTYIIIAFPVNSILSISKINAQQTSHILIVFLFYVLVGLQGGVINAGFRSVGRFAYCTTINNSIRLIEWVMSIFALALDGGVLFVAMVSLMVRCAGTLLLWILLRNQFPWLELGISAVNFKRIRELFKPAIAFMAFPLGLALSLQGMVLVIGALSGPGMVAIFSAYRTFTRILVQGITMINQAIWPEISIAYGAGEIDLVAKLHRHSSSIIFWIALVSFFGLLLIGEWIIGEWTHHLIHSHRVLLCLLLATAFLNVLWQASWVTLMATNRHQQLSIIYIVSASLALFGSSLMLPKMGIDGAGLALFLAELPLFYWAINSAISLLEDSWAIYFNEVIGNPLNKRFFK